MTNLIVKGMVDKIATISPAHIRLTGSATAEITSEVFIVPEAKYPFKVIEALPEKGDNIMLMLKEKTTADGRSGYLLSVRNKTSTKGRYRDKITLKTTSQYQPEILLHVLGNIN
jgi:hypothetical protein